MDPILFLNGVFQMAALNHFAEMLNETPSPPCPHGVVDKAAAEAFATADLAGEKPRLVCHPEHGHFVTHTFGARDEDGGMRMVCWAEKGAAAYNSIACQWWRENNPAYQDGASPTIPGLDRVHEGPGFTALERTGPLPKEDDFS